MAASLSSQPPSAHFYEVTFPVRHVLMVTINREAAMNSIPTAGHLEGIELWKWYNQEPELRVAIVTGKGQKSFCAGADLKEQSGAGSDGSQRLGLPRGGFMGLSQRVGKKPVIAAVNGYALGGGFEIALNCDVVIASPKAIFGLPVGQVSSFSPDAVILSRSGLREAWETGSVERAAQLTDEKYASALLEGENIKIRLKAFVDKKRPEWLPPKL